MRNFYCKTCYDSGEVGFFSKKTYTKCNGDPKGKFMEDHPKPPPPVCIAQKPKKTKKNELKAV